MTTGKKCPQLILHENLTIQAKKKTSQDKSLTNEKYCRKNILLSWRWLDLDGKSYEGKTDWHQRTMAQYFYLLILLE